MKWSDFIGQERIKGELLAIIKGREKYGVPNLILGGPYGCGKTTLARLFAESLGGMYVYYSTGNDQRLYNYHWANSSIVTVIIDEIHLVKKWEALYPLLETMCVIGATTEPGTIDLPFLSRCTLLEFDEYTDKDLESIAILHLKQIHTPLQLPLHLIVARSRGTPRVVVNLAIRLMRYLDVHKIKPTEENSNKVLTEVFQVDDTGLTNQDKMYLKVLQIASRPVGFNTLAAATGFDKEYISTLIEPFLLRKGFVEITAQGRKITQGGSNGLARSNVLVTN